MTKLVILCFFIILSHGAMGQIEENNSNSHEAEWFLESSIEIPKSALPINDKSPKINSAARKSTVLNITSKKRTTAISGSAKGEEKAKSMVQARRPSSYGRPVNLNIPLIPVPSLVKPHKMNIPNRRIFLPVGKS